MGKKYLSKGESYLKAQINELKEKIAVKDKMIADQNDTIESFLKFQG